MTETTPDVLDERLHAAAAIAAMNTQLGPDVAAWEYDTVPGQRGNQGATPGRYVVASVERMYQPADLIGGRPALAGWRLVTRHVGETVAGARWCQLRVTRALEDHALTVAGRLTTPVGFESATAISDDDGMQSGSTTWTYYQPL